MSRLMGKTDPRQKREGMLHEAGEGGFLREGIRSEPRTSEFKQNPNEDAIMPSLRGREGYGVEDEGHILWGGGMYRAGQLMSLIERDCECVN